jgi:DNA damage-binding protein 1
VFIGSTFGDSQLIKLTEERNPETDQLIEIVDTYMNLGPIVDFAAVDVDRQDQRHIVTCSGSFKAGSLRIIRNGIGINEHAKIELSGIKGIWSLNPPEGANVEKYLVVSFVGETRVLAMAGEELDETEFAGFELDQQTIYCCNVISQQYIQVTSKGVYLVDSVSEKATTNWQVPDAVKINLASCNASQALISTHGKNLTLFQITGKKKLDLLQNKTMEHDISC